MPPIRALVANEELQRIFRFGLTGVAGFIVDFGLLVTARSGLGWDLTWALLLSSGLGGIVHYSLTRWWVFPASHTSSEAGRVVRYLLLGAFNAGATVVIVSALTHVGMDYRPAKILCVVVLFGFNYVVTPRLVMPGGPRPPHPPAA